MKKNYLLIGLTIFLLGMGISCVTPDDIEANFEDTEDMSIYNFLEENDSLYGNFFKILKAANVAKTLSAYNPYNDGYTLFLPDTFAVEQYILDNPKYSTLQDLLDDTEFVTSLAEYHVVNLAIDANDFPFGALPVNTMTEDYLTVNFVVKDSGFYMINNQAPVTIENIELSNGFIHVLSKVLQPITYTTYDWLTLHTDYSIFYAAAAETGFSDLLSFNIKDDSLTKTPVTLLVEPDSIYNKQNIFSLDDLITHLGAEGMDHTTPASPLYQFVGYHILDSESFLDDMYNTTTNYTTFSNLPLNINGKDFIDITINKGKVSFDTIVNGTDSTFIDYITFFYDESNINTLSGAIHIIDHVMDLQNPTRATQWFGFWDVAKIAELRNAEEPVEYIFENPNEVWNLSWTGPDPIFIISADEDYAVDDYLLLQGDFSFTYTLPKIVQGEYSIQINTQCFSENNALVEVYFDGSKVGSYLDLTTGGQSGWPYSTKTAGSVTLSIYETHEIELRALVPGRVELNWIQFVPVTD